MEPIVVIGGGVGGLSAIRELEKRTDGAELVLIEPREYAEVPFPAFRALIDPEGLGSRMRKPWSEITSARWISSKAREIAGNEVVLESGERVAFSYAVVATGSTTRGYPFFKGGTANTITERQSEFRAEADKLREAQSVLIIGGGPIGVELAGEVAEAYPDKQVTLVHSGERLLPALPEGAGKEAQKVLGKKGVEIVLGTKLEERDGNWFDGAGAKYEADHVYSAIGIRTDSIPVDGAKPMDAQGRIPVNENLMVRDRVFAIGDVTDVPEIKLGAFAHNHAKVAAKNVAALLADKSNKVKSYKASAPIGFVTLGPSDGIAQLPPFRLDFMIKIKQKDLFISQFLG
jgi:NADH dehydrogenase FAD-containing subunit